jgi:hypothetical protein
MTPGEAAGLHGHRGGRSADRQDRDGAVQRRRPEDRRKLPGTVHRY